MIEQKTRKKGSGRTVGANSYLKISLGELNRLLKPDCHILVSRKFCETLGLNGINYVSTAENLKDVALPPVEVEIENFD